MRLLIGAYTLIWSIAVTAGFQAGEKAPLTLAQAIASVLENNPQLQAAGFDALAAAARIRRQTQTTPWELGVELENLAGTGQSRGVRGMETTLSLGRLLELGDKPQLRGELANAKAKLLQNEQDAQRLDLLAETAKRFTNTAHAQARQKLAHERVDLKKRTLAVVERRVKLGKAPKAERSRSRIDLARAELELEETDHLIAAARRSLAVLWGEIAPSFEKVGADLYHLEPVPDYPTLEQWVEQNPSLARFATQQRLAEARIRLAEASRRPDLELRAGLRHLNGPDDLGLLFSVSMPLGSHERARPALDEAAAISAREPLLAQDQELALRSTLFGLHQELIHARDIVVTLGERIIPAAKSALADYDKGYAAGRYSLLELTQTQDMLLQARLELVNAAVEYQVNRIEIDRLTGAVLSQTSSQGVSR